MRQAGEYRIGAGREAVWRALNDPEILARCIEGCQSMTRTGEDAFSAVVKAKVGPVSALFTAEVALADLEPPSGYTLQANVKGGAAGFGKGTAKVTLAENGGATVLRYEVEGQVGGKLAQVGQRLIDGAARKMADDFFARFGEIVAPGASEKTPAAAVVAQAGPGGGRLWLWLVVAAALAAAAIGVFVLSR